MRILWLPLVMAACTSSSPVAHLAELQNGPIVGTSNGFGFTYDTTVDCFELSSDVHGTVDGAPLSFEVGGLRTSPDATTCASIQVDFPAVLANNAKTSFELSDGATTWSFGVEHLAPLQWTVTSPHDAVEGSDFTVGFAPTPPGVGLELVSITPTEIYVSPFEGAPRPGTNTVHIDAGYWSGEQEPGSGSPATGTLEIQVGPLVVDGCPVASCEFSTQPQPTKPVTIVVP
jgi:hypothetical protein